MIKHWTATRSGASMTVSGVDADGKVVKITHVREIAAPVLPGKPAKAIDREGVTYDLAI